MKCIKSNFYKLWKLKLGWVHLGFCLTMMLGLAGYFYIAGWSSTRQLEGYSMLITWALPMFVAVVITLVYEADCKAGRFQLLLATPGSKMKAHGSNLLAALMMGGLTIFGAILGFGLLFLKSKTGDEAWLQAYNIGSFIEMALLVTGVAISLYVLQYIICYSFGKGVSLSIGAIGTLLAPLMLLGIGDRVWKLFPCCYAMRMAKYQLLEQMRAVENSALIMQDYHRGGAVIFGGTLILLAVFAMWSSRWQGTQEMAE